jgi:hypothetical protein
VGKSEQRKRLTPLLPRIDPVLSANYTADNKAPLSFPRAPSNGFMINLAFLPRQIIGSIPVIINSRARTPLSPQLEPRSSHENMSELPGYLVDFLRTLLSSRFLRRI